MRKSSFYLTILIICSCINYSLSASNSGESEQCDMQRIEVHVVTALKGLFSFLNLLTRFAECSLNHGINQLASCIPTTLYLMKIVNNSIEEKSKMLTKKEKEVLAKSSCSADLTEIFEEVNHVIDSCLYSKLTVEMAESLKTNLFNLIIAVYSQITYFGTESLFPQLTIQDLDNYFGIVSSAAGYTTTKLVAITSNKNPNRNNNSQSQYNSETSKKSTKKRETIKQINSLELEKAKNAANLNAHLIMGCCKDGTCDIFKPKAKLKAKSKRGGRKKKLKETTLNHESLEDNSEGTDDISSESLVNEPVSIMSKVLDLLATIAILEEKLITTASAYRTTLEKILANNVATLSESLQERLSVLPENIILQSSNEKSTLALKCQYKENIKRMTTSLPNNGRKQNEKSSHFKQPNGRCCHCSCTKCVDNSEICSVD